MKKFKVGDRVTAIGNIDEYFGAGTIIEVDPNPNTSLSYLIDFDCRPGSLIWAYNKNVKRIPAQTIVIHQNGQTTKAILKEGKETIRTAEARCSPDDTYDFEVGAKIAFERLMDDRAEKEKRTEPKQEDTIKLYCVKSYNPGKWVTKGKIYEIDEGGQITFDDGYTVKWSNLSKPSSMTNPLFPLVKRPAKAGEWVYIDNADDPNRCGVTLCGNVKVGELLFMDGKKQRPDDHGFICGVGASVGEYLVLDGYKGAKNL